MREAWISWYEKEYRPYAPNLDRGFGTLKEDWSDYSQTLLFHKFYLFAPISVGVQTQSLSLVTRCFSFMFTEIDYLMVGLFYDLVQHPS